MIGGMVAGAVIANRGAEFLDKGLGLYHHVDEDEEEEVDDDDDDNDAKESDTSKASTESDAEDVAAPQAAPSIFGVGSTDAVRVLSAGTNLLPVISVRSRLLSRRASEVVHRVAAEAARATPGGGPVGGAPVGEGFADAHDVDTPHKPQVNQKACPKLMSRPPIGMVGAGNPAALDHSFLLS